jgi:hypothetical protein
MHFISVSFLTDSELPRFGFEKMFSGSGYESGQKEKFRTRPDKYPDPQRL